MIFIIIFKLIKNNTTLILVGIVFHCFVAVSPCCWSCLSCANLSCNVKGVYKLRVWQCYYTLTCVCMCVRATWVKSVSHQTDGPPEQYFSRWPLVTVPPRHSDTHTHSLSFNPVSTPQQAGQMAAPRPAVPGKACELKVIPSRFEELPAPPRRGKGGASAHQPPGLGTSGWGFVEWWARRRHQPPLLPPRPAARRKERQSSVQFFSLKMNRWAVCAQGCMCLHLCVRERQTVRDWWSLSRVFDLKGGTKWGGVNDDYHGKIQMYSQLLVTHLVFTLPINPPIIQLK